MNTRNENQAEERQPLQLRWYCLSANGMATLALDENDARNVALESDQLYPRNGPHQAVQMVPVQPDGRGTDAQILKERDIARCAIVGALAAGHAGQPHPGADHWLAAAHDAGVTIASLERADRPVGGWQGDAFQSMEHPFSPHTGDAAEAAMADLDKACCKPLPNAASAALDSMMGRSEWPAFTAARSEPGAEVDSMGIPTSCGKPLCSPDAHHPLCKLHQPAECPATQVLDKRSAFEAWLRTKPEVRLWNTTDAMLAAYQAGRAALPAPQQATPEPVQPFLVRDVAALLGASVPDVCKALAHLGHGQRSTNMEIKPEEALAVAKHIRAAAAATEPVQGLIEALDWITENGADEDYGVRQRARDALAAYRQSTPEPIPMVMHCPKCGMQHVDGEEWEDDPHDIEQGQIRTWKNEPHRSHLCHGCGTIWRPADVPTTGVKAITTKGKADTWAPEQATQQAAGEPRCSTCGVTMDEPHHPACGAVTAAIIGLSTMAAQDKEARRRELAEKIRETLRGVFTRPAPCVPDGLPAVLTHWGFDVHDDEDGRTWLTIRNDQDDVARLSVPTFWPASGRQTIGAVVLHQFSAALTSALAAAQAKGGAA